MWSTTSNRAGQSSDYGPPRTPLHPSRGRPTPDTDGRAKSGTVGSAARCSEKPGSPTTAITGTRARAGSSPPACRTIRSCAASTMAISGDHPTSMACGCRSLARLPAARAGTSSFGDASRTTHPSWASRTIRSCPLRGSSHLRPRRARRRGRFHDHDGRLRRICANEGLRRMLVNACYWTLGMEDQIPPKSDVDLVGHYAPTPFDSTANSLKGVKPADLALPR